MAIEIVTSHWKEDLTWLLKSPWPVNLIDKEGAAPSPFTPKFVIPNQGNAEIVYMKYIIENYDNLPDHVAFIHGHEDSYHQFHRRPLLDVIMGANIHRYDFIPLNNIFRQFYFNDFVDDIVRFKTFFTYFGFYECDTPPNNARIVAPMCSQFIASRNAIRRYPKKEWTRWYNLMANESRNYVSLGVCFIEHFWHIIFGQGRICGPNPDWFSFYTPPVDWNEHVKLPHFPNIEECDLKVQFICSPKSPVVQSPPVPESDPSKAPCVEGGP
jgi:hypothetical protein